MVTMAIREETKEDINKVNVLTERVKRRMNEFREAKVHICSERSRLVTESWKETEGEPLVIRRAKLLQKMLEGLSVVIRDGELIVGSQTKYVRGASPPIDYSPGPSLEAIYAEEPTANSPMVAAVLSEEDRKRLLEDVEYWKGKTPGEQVKKRVQEIVIENVDDYQEANIFLFKFERPTSARVLDGGKIITKGLKGILGDIREEIKNLDFYDNTSLKKYEFLKAGIISCEAVINFAHRYAKLARELAEKESDPVRKGELELIAEHCEWVPENPARTFHEALQSFWLTWVVLNLEAASHSEAPGRMDQHLYPIYEKDIREGRITRQQAAELLGLLWVKFNEMETIKGKSIKQASQGSQFQDVAIGGVTKEGTDASNELTFLMLEVAAQTKLPQPPLYIRCHKGINEDVLEKAVETNRRHGAGIPAFINDEVSLINLMERGIPLREARDYIVGGCIGLQLPNGTNLDTPFQFSTPKIFEIFLNNGIDPKTGKRLGPATGDLRNFSSYDELYSAWLKHFEFFAELAYKIYQVFILARAEYTSYIFTSILLDDCIKKGRGYEQGGARYPQMDVGFVPIGHQNVADGLTAIKKLVFEEKKMTMGELLDALDANFEGKEEIRQMLLTVPKYGNDDDYADETFNQLSLDVTRIMSQYPDWEGYPMAVMRGGGSGHFWGGVTVGALPDGRKAYEATADGNLSPVQGMDTKGPTAVILSATKVNQTEYALTTLLNMKITPSILNTREGISKVVSLIKTLFDMGGWHVQFNMVDKQTMIEAQKHPEQYRNLVVRVAGYSAYFVELTPEIQNDIISRTEHSI
jgi:pyruvate formate-lyase/glycerol dehydratase family glycyl radical enzyme